jgi:UDP-N-acetylglucosamine diphosphorylase/glucosamine-1-phosphate N-acetyltransferase
MSSRNLFYPFSQFSDEAHMTIGAYSWAERWAIINSFLVVADTYENRQLFPSLALLEYVRENKTLPHPLYDWCLVAQDATDLLTLHNELLQFDLATSTSKKLQLTPTERYRNIDNIFIEENAQLEYCFLDASKGPIYIANGATLQDNVCIKGPVYIGENSIVKMGATIYGTTIIGSQCIVGGEIKNSIMMNNSNKSHYGYIGDSIIGAWCNLGAGTTNSNVKNNASIINVTLGSKQKAVGNKFGCLIGDFTKLGINSTINTGTVIGTCCNLFGTEFPAKHTPNFSWGNSGEKYKLPQLLNDLKKWMEFKQQILNNDTIEALTTLYKN